MNIDKFQENKELTWVTSYVKEVLIKEYEDDIGLHERPEKNKSKFVYDIKCGGN